MELLNFAQDWCQAVNQWMTDNGHQPVAVTDHATEHQELCGQPVREVEPGRVVVDDNTQAGTWTAVFDPDARRWVLED